MFGHIRFFEHFSKQYITGFFKLADYIELNDNAQGLLFEKLGIKTEVELFELLDLELLVITKGKRGATFVFRNEHGAISVLDQEPEIVVNSVDTTGAGDAFFSTMLKEYAYTNKVDKDFVIRAFPIANQASREILMQFGGRKH